MAARAHVAIAYPVAVPWMALFVRGVVEYADRHGVWDLTTSPPTITGSDEFALSIENLKGWPGHGVIAAIGSRREARAAGWKPVPRNKWPSLFSECTARRPFPEWTCVIPG